VHLAAVEALRERVGALPADGDVIGYSITVEGSRVVYLAEQDNASQRELYRVPILGGPSVKLNASLAAGTNMGSYVLSPDGSRVVYLALHQKQVTWALYAASLGSPLKMP
jgi:hypothetical protein